MCSIAVLPHSPGVVYYHLLLRFIILIQKQLFFAVMLFASVSLHFLAKFETGIKTEKRNDKADRECEKLRDYDKDGGDLG